jgi:Zn-dependent protease with chaperone function
MDDVWTFLVACWTSGTLLRSACALIIIPIAAWAAVRVFAVPLLARLSGDPGWQAPLAAASAAIPGLLLLVLAGSGFISGLDAACRQTVTGQVLFALVVLATTFALSRALLLSIQRWREAEALVRASTPASGRLEQLAARSGVVARAIESDQPFCALARIWHPLVIVSHAAVRRLDDAELEAALHHERGHLRRGDQVIAAGLTFLVDLLPLPALDLVSMYRRSRELAADRHALHSVTANDLAGALLSFVRPVQTLGGTAAIDGEGTVAARLNLLLRDPLPPPVSVLQRGLLAFTLISILGVGLAPDAATLIHPVPCQMKAELRS